MLGPHWVLVDDIPPSIEAIDPENLGPRMEALFAGGRPSPFGLYQERYLRSEPFPFRGKTGPPLRELDFMPTLVSAQARYSDLLQMADVIASCTNDFVTTTSATLM